MPVTGGHVKCQWKADWAMRWAALGVDYEMSGKDLIDSVKLSSRICGALGGDPPEGFNYELFLDENGQKISKSKGNGLTIDEWLTYASPESLSLFMFQKPKAAKRLYFDVIPKAVDEYFTFLDAYRAARTTTSGSPTRSGTSTPARRQTIEMPVSFAMLLNLASASNAHDKGVLWGFILAPRDGRDAGEPSRSSTNWSATRCTTTTISSKPKKVFRAPDDVERDALAALDQRLAALPADADGETIQSAVLDVARAEPALSGPCATGSERRPRRVGGVVFDALPDPARPGARSPLRFVRRDLWHPGDARADRQGARRRTRRLIRPAGGQASGGVSPRQMPRPAQRAASAALR